MKALDCCTADMNNLNTTSVVCKQNLIPLCDSIPGGGLGSPVSGSSCNVSQISTTHVGPSQCTTYALNEAYRSTQPPPQTQHTHTHTHTPHPQLLTCSSVLSSSAGRHCITVVTSYTRKGSSIQRHDRHPAVSPRDLPPRHADADGGAALQVNDIDLQQQQHQQQQHAGP